MDKDNLLCALGIHVLVNHGGEIRITQEDVESVAPERFDMTFDDDAGEIVVKVVEHE